MSTNELPPEKRIANNLPIPDHPPVPSSEELENPEAVTILSEPPHTRLLLEGFDHEEITADFLVDVHDLADDHGLPLEAISVGQPGSGKR